MKLVIYKTKLGPQRGYRWRLVADNSKVLANGGQGYSRRKDMERAVILALGGTLVATDSGRLVDLVRVTDDIDRVSRDRFDTDLCEVIPVEDRTRGTR